MVDDVLLTPATYDVLRRVPTDWWDEDGLKEGIAAATGLAQRDLTARLAHLLKLRLIERRTVHRIAPHTELRRVAKD